jgi:hypothetical protein
MRRGAYGFAFEGLPESADDLLVEAGPDDPLVTVRWRQASWLHDVEVVTADRLCYGFRRSFGFCVERDPRAVVFDVPWEAGDEVVHPLLTTPSAVLAKWRGDFTFHGGAFALAGGAWAVLAQKEGGKSSTLAGLAARGVAVLTDDLVIVSPEGRVLPGPACIDLRTEAHEAFGGEDIGVVGARPRFRLRVDRPRLPDGPLPLRGIFVLAWGSSGPGAAVRRIPPADRLELLARHEGYAIAGPFDPLRLLDLAQLPVWEVSRPREWGSLDATLDTLDEVVAGAE